MEESKNQINHTTYTHPKLWNRIMILFGATIQVDSVIKVDKDVEVKFSSATDSYIFH